MSSSNVPESVLRHFVVCCLKTQVDIAHRVRDIQNADYILFDPSFRRTHHIRIGDYRVEVDALGRKAITSAAAKEAFDSSDYWAFVSKFDDAEIIKNKECIALLAKPIIKSRSKITPSRSTSLSSASSTSSVPEA